MRFKIIIVFLFSILANDFVFAQETPAPKDSTQLYRNIETYSGHSKFTRFLYKLVFKPVAKKSVISKKTKAYKKLIKKSYSPFEGKTIRNIDIVTLDPFGYSISDTTKVPQNFLANKGNQIHIKSLGITIRNLLLIRKNQPFDSLLIKESERLVRSMAYIHDVSFFVRNASASTDSVDVFIRVLDNWSIAPRVSSSSTHTTIGITDQNFLGLGHQFDNDIKRNYDNGDFAFTTNYYIPNIRNTYVNANLQYAIDGERYSNKSLTVDRPFFSPFARWAAGVSFIRKYSNDSLLRSDSIYEKQQYEFNSQDYWAGYAMPIFKGRIADFRTTNIITAARFLRIRYLDKPNEIIDPDHYYSDENLYLGSIGLSERKYVQDRYIFKFGFTEDVPIGKVFNLTAGFQERNNVQRTYLGAKISVGNYYSWGYLSSSFEYGTFFNGSNAEQGVIKAGMNYFTGLFEIGNWKFRQFVKPRVAIGMNRLSYDSLTLNDGYGLDGFNSLTLTGTNRMILTLQTQSYAPWNIIGFKFGPYLICSLGMLGDEANGFKKGKVYSQVGLGVMIKNDYLVFGTFQFSLSFYPSIPGQGNSVFKFNSFKTTDFGFKDFEIGKPGIVQFH